MGSKRTDNQCQTCGRFRHRKCDKCGQGNLIPDLNTGSLVDHANRTLHVCGMGQVDSIPQQVQTIESQVNAKIEKVSDAVRGMRSHTTSSAAEFVPPMEVYERYIPRRVDGKSDLEVMEIAYRKRKNVLLIGDAGVGKNHLIDALGAKLGVPTVSISLNGGSTVEDILGQPLFIGGETVWVDGMLPHYMPQRAILCLDEINACPNDISFVLHQVMDWRRRLVLVQKGREVIYASPEFMVVGTMNPDYRGTKPLNEAFKDRFQVKLKLDYDRKIEAKLGIEDKWLDLADQLRKMYRETELETPCSTRMLLDYKSNTEDFGESCAREFFLSNYGQTEQQAVKQAVSIHVDKAKGALTND